MLDVQVITFTQILPIWKNELWPDRMSEIETHSAMTWPKPKAEPYDMGIFSNPVYFWGIYDGGDLIAVNSGHLSSPLEFRSRGLWVHPNYRSLGLSQQLLLAAKQTAISSTTDGVMPVLLQLLKIFKIFIWILKCECNKILKVRTFYVKRKIFLFYNMYRWNTFNFFAKIFFYHRWCDASFTDTYIFCTI